MEAKRITLRSILAHAGDTGHITGAPVVSTHVAGNPCGKLETALIFSYYEAKVQELAGIKAG